MSESSGITRKRAEVCEVVRRVGDRVAEFGLEYFCPDYVSKIGVSVTGRTTCKIITEPENLKEAEGQPDWPIWKQAMKVEMDQHNDVGTWQLVELPTGWTAIGCRWVYAVKTTPDGNF